MENIGKNNKKVKNRLEKLRKIALFFISIGEKEASNIISLLDEATIEELMLEVAKITATTKEEKENAILEFSSFITKKNYSGGIDKAKEILIRSLGDTKADSILDKIKKRSFSEEISLFNQVDSSILSQILSSESPQAASVFLSVIEAKKSAQVLKLLPKSFQIEVASKIANHTTIHPDIVHQVFKVIKQKVSEKQHQELTKSGGIDTLANILNHMDRGIENSILNSIEQTSPEIANEIKDKLYTFEDILKLTDKEMRLLLSRIELKNLAIALRGVETEIKEHFFNNLSKNRVHDIITTMENTNSLPLSQINNERNSIIETAKKLEAEKLILIKKEKEELI